MQYQETQETSMVLPHPSTQSFFAIAATIYYLGRYSFRTC